MTGTTHSDAPFMEQHCLKVYVGRLRDKLERDPASPKLILTVRGVGYRFAEAGEVRA